MNACNNSFLKEDWNAVVINTVHSGISASDALTIFFKGVRHTGERHRMLFSCLIHWNCMILRIKTGIY